jgi:PRTRC genetic system ThiF family protein
MKKERIHYLEKVLANPVHPISVKVIGVGGNGTTMIANLARINCALLALDHMGISVTAYDFDKVSNSNIGRQLYYDQDIGQNKAKVFIGRVNRTYGFDWKYEERYFTQEDFKHDCNILISCVDKGGHRKDFDSWFKYARKLNSPVQTFDKVYYWMDMGNSRTAGQVILGSQIIEQPKSSHKTVNKLKTVVDIFPDISKRDNDEDQGPSCSTLEALNRQDLFINTGITYFASKLLWELLHNLQIPYQGIYYNGEINHEVAISV